MSNFNTIMNCANTNLLAAANNLSDVSSAATARSNLGLGLPIIVGSGGTGDSTLTAHGLLIGEGTSAVAVTGTQTAGQVLLGQGVTADPLWKSFSGAFTNDLNGVATLGSAVVGTSNVANSAITNALLANMAAHTWKLNNTGGSAAPIDATDAQAQTEIGFVTSGVGGASGEITIPGGLLLKWGNIASLASGVSSSPSFTNAFASTCGGVQVSPAYAAGNTAVVHLTGSCSTTSFTVRNEGALTVGPIYWFAIGN